MDQILGAILGSYVKIDNEIANIKEIMIKINKKIDTLMAERTDNPESQRTINALRKPSRESINCKPNGNLADVYPKENSSLNKPKSKQDAMPTVESICKPGESCDLLISEIDRSKVVIPSLNNRRIENERKIVNSKKESETKSKIQKVNEHSISHDELNESFMCWIGNDSSTEILMPKSEFTIKQAILPKYNYGSSIHLSQKTPNINERKTRINISSTQQPRKSRTPKAIPSSQKRPSFRNLSNIFENKKVAVCSSPQDEFFFNIEKEVEETF